MKPPEVVRRCVRFPEQQQKAVPCLLTQQRLSQPGLDGDPAEQTIERRAVPSPPDSKFLKVGERKTAGPHHQRGPCLWRDKGGVGTRRHRRIKTAHHTSIERLRRIRAGKAKHADTPSCVAEHPPHSWRLTKGGI